MNIIAKGRRMDTSKVVERVSLIMAAMDMAALVIEQGLPEVAEVLLELKTNDVITNVEYQAWKRKLTAVGSGVSGDVLGIHSKMVERAKKLDIDVPPPADGREELIERVNNLIVPFGGGDR